MDDKLFKELLSQVADWNIPKIPVSDVKIAVRARRGRRTNEEQYQDEHEEIFKDLFDGVNPTYPINLKNIKSKTQNCDDCGRACEKPRLKDYKLYKGKKRTAWREKCSICSQFQNPYTGRFELTVNQAHSAMCSYIAGNENSEYAMFNPDQDTKE